MVVQYPRTVWKNSYAEHEVTGKTYNNKKQGLTLSYNTFFVIPDAQPTVGIWPTEGSTAGGTEITITFDGKLHKLHPLHK